MTPAEAASFIETLGLTTSDISPRLFALAAGEAGLDPTELLLFLGRMLDTQGQGPAPIATQLAGGQLVST